MHELLLLYDRFSDHFACKNCPSLYDDAQGEERGRTYRVDVVICSNVASLDPVRCSFRLCACCLHNTSQVIQNQGAHMIRCYS